MKTSLTNWKTPQEIGNQQNKIGNQLKRLKISLTNRKSSWKLKQTQEIGISLKRLNISLKCISRGWKLKISLATWKCTQEIENQPKLIGNPLKSLEIGKNTFGNQKFP